MSEPLKPELRGAAARGKPIPLLRWPLWAATLAIALVVFYGILTPVWMILRAVARLGERAKPGPPAA